MENLNRLYVGYDCRMPLAFSIAVKSACETTKKPLGLDMLHLHMLQAAGLYKRPTLKTRGGWHDVISDAPMSTQFALTRFLVPYLCGYNGWAAFCDSDFLFRADIDEVFQQRDESKAVMVVKHKYEPTDVFKMDGQVQTAYPRKNWSSFILFNCGHERNKFLSLEQVNKQTGRFLHGFSWIPDDEIGELKEEWNWLEGHSKMDIEPKAVHFTRGTPDMEGYSGVKYADEWNEYARGFVI